MTCSTRGLLGISIRAGIGILHGLLPREQRAVENSGIFPITDEGSGGRQSHQQLEQSAMQSQLSYRELNEAELSTVSGGDASVTPEQKAASTNPGKLMSQPPAVFEKILSTVGLHLY
jgi:hypothetical protein